MECRACSETLTALIDGELSSEERERTDEHLDGCWACRREYESLLYSYSLVDSLPLLEPEPQLWQRIRREIEVDVAPARTHERRMSFFNLRDLLPRRWVPATAVLGVLAIGLSVALLVNPDPQRAEVERALRAYVQDRENGDLEHRNVFRRVRALGSAEARTNPFARPVGSLERNPFSLE